MGNRFGRRRYHANESFNDESSVDGVLPVVRRSWLVDVGASELTHHRPPLSDSCAPSRTSKLGVTRNLNPLCLIRVFSVVGISSQWVALRRASQGTCRPHDALLWSLEVCSSRGDLAGLEEEGAHQRGRQRKTAEDRF